MKILFYGSLAFLVLSFSTIKAQENIQIYTDKSAIYLSEEISLKSQFLDTLFYNGKVLFKNGSSSKALMNYNLIDNGISFVKDDIVHLLSGIENIALVTYNKRIFIPYKGFFLEQVSTFKNEVLLMVERKSTIKTNEVSGAYGMNSQSSNIGKFSNLSGVGFEQSFKDLDKNINIDIKLEISFYIKIGDKISPINRVKDLKKLFPNKKDGLLNYISSNKLDLSNINGLNRIIDYCLSE